MRVQKLGGISTVFSSVVQLLKSWEYKNLWLRLVYHRHVVQLLKSWEYKNFSGIILFISSVVQLLKSWEYKNEYCVESQDQIVVQLLKSWEYKNNKVFKFKTRFVVQLLKSWEYKNALVLKLLDVQLYSYLNLESTKTSNEILTFLYPHSDYKINNCPCQFLLSKNLCNSSSSGVWEYLIQ